MTLLRRLRVRLSFFATDGRGSTPIEGVLASTFLLWWYMASFTFFDAYRQKNVNLKAAYTIADMLSRQTETVSPAYMRGLNTVFDYLTFSSQPTVLRVSSVYWDADLNTYRIAWSYSTNTTKYPVQTDATIALSKDRIPTMPVGDTVVLVETFMAFSPVFNVGLTPRWYDTFITTRPRFASQVVFDPNA
ncbi:MAG: TadE/TadG family type IV pilus assembly protein [Pseudomonadota bacterium]|jgi:Flp pilus assembly protein TadG